MNKTYEHVYRDKNQYSIKIKWKKIFKKMKQPSYSSSCGKTIGKILFAGS